MVLTVSTLRRAILEAYVGDPETRLIHRYRDGCADIRGTFFLDVRTALLHGYRPCTCCGAQREQPSLA